MRVVALVGLVLDVGGVDRDAALFFLGSGVDFGRSSWRVARPFLARIARDGRGQRGLAVINVADRADVNVRFIAFELLP